MWGLITMSFSDVPKCTKMAQTTGKRCGQPAMRGRDVCRKHGGKTPRGWANPNTKHGRYSKDLPTRLAGKYKQALTDPELLSIRSDIALLDTRISELVASVDEDPVGNIWGQVRKAYNQINDAILTKDSGKIISAMHNLDTITQAGFADFQTWDEIRKLLQERARLVSAESKRLNDAQLTITAERAMLLITAIASVVMEHVTDNAIKAKITRDIDKLIAAPVQ
jgi:hypothetical protein